MTDPKTLAFMDTRQTLAAAVTDARANITRLKHFADKGDRVMYSAEKARAAVKRLDDAVKDFEDFTAANPGLPS